MGLDELIELYACIFQREKGSIGLLFELNQFMGLGIMGYLGYFYYHGKHTVPEEYAALEAFINFQLLYLYIVAGVCIMMFICMGCMQKRVTRKEASTKVDYQRQRDLDED